MNITTNSHEHSLTIDNLDIVVMRPFGNTDAELVIEFKDQEGNPLQSVILTVEQAQYLRAHLNSTAVQQIFRQGQEQHLGVETGYMKAVRITEPLGTRV
jgi:hypothetical protein